MEQVKIKDGVNNLHLYIWKDVIKPKGVVQIVHGVNEHGLRYKEFAEYLNQEGFIVYVHDHISQGLSRTPDETTVYFGKEGVANLQRGVNLITDRIKSDYVNLPIYAVGHSLGATILRSLLINGESPYKKVILNGTGASSTKGLGLIITFGEFLKLFKAKKPSKFFDNIFRQTQYRLKEKVEMNHFIEWLTRDMEKTELNKKDEFLFISLSVSAFVDILKLFKLINNPRNLKDTSKDVEILLMCGTHDPATNFGDDLVHLNSLYNDVGVNSIYKLYEEGRHDSFQEINREEVFRDIVNFIIR